MKITYFKFNLPDNLDSIEGSFTPYKTLGYEGLIHNIEDYLFPDITGVKSEWYFRELKVKNGTFIGLVKSEIESNERTKRPRVMVITRNLKTGTPETCDIFLTLIEKLLEMGILIKPSESECLAYEYALL